MAGYRIGIGTRLACASLVCLLGLGSALAREPTRDQDLARWERFNSLCRGGRGDDPRTQRACERRDRISLELAAEGWCYGRPGEFGYQKSWRRC